MDIVVLPCARPSFRPERRYHSISVRISVIGLEFGGMVHNTIKQVVI